MQSTHILPQPILPYRSHIIQSDSIFSVYYNNIHTYNANINVYFKFRKLRQIVLCSEILKYVIVPPLWYTRCQPKEVLQMFFRCSSDARKM